MLDLQTIKSAVRHMAPKYDILHVELFGSCARGEGKDSSDVDILLDTGTAFSLLDASRFRAELAGTLGTEVDVVSRAALYEPIAKHALKDAVLLYEHIEKCPGVKS